MLRGNLPASKRWDFDDVPLKEAEDLSIARVWLSYNSEVWYGNSLLSRSSFRVNIFVVIVRSNPTKIRERLRSKPPTNQSRRIQTPTDMCYDVVDIISSLLEGFVHVHEWMWHARKSPHNDIVTVLPQFFCVCFAFVA